MPSELLSYILSIAPEFRKSSRLSSLYSDFTRLKSLNPDGYAANINTWRSVLSRALLAGRVPTPNSSSASGVGENNDDDNGDSLILHVGEELKAALETEHGARPVGLGWVVAEALKDKAWIPDREFLAARESVYRWDWTEASWRLVEWGLEKIGFVLWNGAVSRERAGYGRYVVMGNVEEVAKQVLKRASARQTIAADRIYSLETFKEEFRHVVGSEVGLSETDFTVLLTFLRRDKRAISFDGQTVKFASPDGSLDPIMPQDTSIAHLTTLIRSLHSQTAALIQRISTLTTQAHTHLSSKNRTAALSALRSRKLAESALKQRSDTLAQLEEVLSSIQQATDQVEIMRVLEGSRVALTGLNRQIGGADRVWDVIEDLREEMGKTEEVGEILREGVAGPVDDEGEVDEELAAMEAEEKRKEEEERTVKEDRQAEETRRRLAEIETPPPMPAQAEEQPSAEGPLGVDDAASEDRQIPDVVNDDGGLEESTKRLSKMSVEDNDATGKEETAQERRKSELTGALPAE